jgi:hypothetical protein
MSQETARRYTLPKLRKKNQETGKSVTLSYDAETDDITACIVYNTVLLRAHTMCPSRVVIIIFISLIDPG